MKRRFNEEWDYKKDLKYYNQRQNGFYRAPFAYLAFFNMNDRKAITRNENELRAIENINIFTYTLIIFLRRIKNEIESNELFHLYLDIQSLILFSEQFLQDIGLVVRLYSPMKFRSNISPKFHKMRKNVNTLEFCKELQDFLKKEKEWFDVWKDLRDDISHRTSFEKMREVVFPDVRSFMLIVSGKKIFLKGMDLKKYIREYLDKLLFFACLVEDFIKQRYVNLKKSYFIADKIELVIFHEHFSEGTGAVGIGEESIKLLDWLYENK